MIITKQRIVVIVVLIAFLIPLVIMGIRMCQMKKQNEGFVLNQGLHTREHITGEYIPKKLEIKSTDELARMGETLWGE